MSVFISVTPEKLRVRNATPGCEPPIVLELDPVSVYLNFSQARELYADLSAVLQSHEADEHGIVDG
jgi:hypothetical protein